MLSVVEEHAVVVTTEVSPTAIADRWTETLGWDEIRRIHYGSKKEKSTNSSTKPMSGDSSGGRGSNNGSGGR